MLEARFVSPEEPRFIGLLKKRPWIEAELARKRESEFGPRRGRGFSVTAPPRRPSCRYRVPAQPNTLDSSSKVSRVLRLLHRSYSLGRTGLRSAIASITRATAVACTSVP